MTRRTNRAGAGLSQRQLRVGELLRAALVEALARGHLRDPVLQGVTITVTEVRMSPDLRHARAFIMPLGGAHADDVIVALNRAAGYLRHEVDRRVELRLSPEFHFELDGTFGEAARIEALLRQTPPTPHD
ncbi:MAG: 30S ribosome-binding factor RbfA [Alphaproteobacteria bacterium]|nr:30S ribosome-binding factor RbfA [Alphaproteobacteria bacterium]